MDFRTEIGAVRGGFTIDHADRIVLLGSCFADNVGERLAADGFEAAHNPLGPLYNPASVLRVLKRGVRPYGEADFQCCGGVWHCLDFANRYQAATPTELAAKVNADYLPLASALAAATVIIITFGTTGVYRYGADHVVAGNCHKLPASFFCSSALTVPEIAEPWIAALETGKRYIFTVSPVRYTSGGLAVNGLSKATLRVAVDEICRRGGSDYFPAFEILNDDLRDYRFYAADMKHPSPVAADYIYDVFGRAYYSPETLDKAARCRRDFLRSQHRPIISDK